MIADVLSKLEVLKPLLNRYGVKEFYIKLFKEELGRSENIKEMEEWLTNIETNELAETEKIFNLIPSYQWENYKLFNLQGTQEQILLSKAKKKLYQKWRDRYAKEVASIIKPLQKDEHAKGT